MFNKFSLAPRVCKNEKRHRATLAAYPKLKRRQVKKACHSCRISRIKCDEDPPCSNCVVKGIDCMKDGSPNTQTLASANRQIEELQSKIKFLEENYLVSPQPRTPNSNMLSPSSPPANAITSASPQMPLEDESIMNDYNRTNSNDPENTLRIEKLWTRSTHHYGPSSDMIFLDRIASFLTSNSKQQVSTFSLVPELEKATYVDASSCIKNFSGFSKRQEEGFLDLFPQTYHSLVPALHLESFMEHFASLWPKQRLDQHRQDSPLVDIILAVCIQYGRTFVQEPATVIDNQDTVFAGVWYYRQCQIALLDEWKTPLLRTVQCYIFTVIYLRNSSFTNIAYITLGTAVQIAQTLGLHLEPSHHLPTTEQELRKQIWWSLNILDTKLSIELGRPSAIQIPSNTVSLPGDNHVLARLLGPQFSLESDDITWLSFYRQKIKLLEAAREANHSCYGEDGESHSLFKGYSFFKAEDTSIEHSAILVTKYMEPLYNWATELPQALRLRRQNSEDFLSVDGSLIELDTKAPFWLQLQKISLELQYHHLILTFSRQYIRFKPISNSSLPRPQADLLAIASLTHSLAITDIIHTTLTTSRVLNGWYDAFHIQWQASLTIMAFVLVYPDSARAAAARKSITLSIEIFNIFAVNCPTAAKMADILKNLRWKAGGLTMRSRSTKDPLPRDLSESIVSVGGESLHSSDWTADFLRDFETSGSPFDFDCVQGMA